MKNNENKIWKETKDLIKKERDYYGCDAFLMMFVHAFYNSILFILLVLLIQQLMEMFNV